jgi:hypothetical protein
MFRGTEQANNLRSRQNSIGKLSTGMRRMLLGVAGKAYVSATKLIWHVNLNMLFDRAGYLATYRDVEREGLDPVFHYLWTGAQEGRQPHPDFDTKFYLRTYPDVAASRINPLVHYLRFGRHEGRLAKPLSRALARHRGAPATFEEIARMRVGRVMSISKVNGTPGRLIWCSDGDPVSVDGEDACLSGWCFLDDFTLPLSIELAVNDRVVPGFTRQERPDVAAVFRNPALLDCGFIVRAPLSNRPATAVLSAQVPAGKVRLAKVRLPKRAPLRAGRREALNCYAEWIAAFDCAGQRIPRSDIAGPLMSVLVPTYNSNPYFLSRAVASVIRQSYDNWELVIVDDASTASSVAAFLQSAASLNPRVRLLFRKAQGHISTATNDALQAAKGEYVLLLDHDDELHPEALESLVQATVSHPDAVLVYTDEDKLDSMGRRVSPAFKPGFDLDFLRATDYIGHIVCVRRDAALSLGGLRDECVGAQDWDLLLRVAETLRPHQIVHVPRPLYHWRQHSSSTAQSIEAKPYVRSAWRRVSSDHVERCGLKANIEPGLLDGCVRLHFRVPQDAKLMVILTDQAAVASRNALLNAARFVGNLEFRSLRDGSAVQMVSDRDLTRDTLVFVGGSIETVNDKFFEELAAQALRPDCGYVGGVLLSSDRKVIEAGYYMAGQNAVVNPFAGAGFEVPGFMRLLKTTHRTAFASTGFFAARSGLIEDLGGVGFLRATDPVDAAILTALKSASAGNPPLFTPYAVLTAAEPFSAERGSDACTRMMQRINDSGQLGKTRLPAINQNLLAFEQLATVFANGLD